MGGTTGISHAGTAVPRSATARNRPAITALVARPPMVPSAHSVPAIPNASPAGITVEPTAAVPAPTVSTAIGSAP